MGSYYLLGSEFQFCKTKMLWRWRVVAQQCEYTEYHCTSHLKVVKRIVCILPQKKKRKRKRKSYGGISGLWKRWEETHSAPQPTAESQPPPMLELEVGASATQHGGSRYFAAPNTELSCAACDSEALVERQDHSEHTGSLAPLPQSLQDRVSTWNFSPSIPISWQNTLLSSVEEEMRSSLKAHVPSLSHSVIQKVSENWSVKKISSGFIQQLVG